VTDPKSDDERINRELIELLNELRVALPGVQVLFAFLLVLPFQQGFASISDSDRVVYFAALLSCAAAGAMLIAPSAYHRLNFRRRNKERLLRDSNRLAIAGTTLTGVGIACSIYLIADVIYGGGVAIVATVATVGVYAALWGALPVLRRRDPDD
jgi:pilus assembly protein TadC